MIEIAHIILYAYATSFLSCLETFGISVFFKDMLLLPTTMAIAMITHFLFMRCVHARQAKTKAIDKAMLLSYLVKNL